MTSMGFRRKEEETRTLNISKTGPLTRCFVWSLNASCQRWRQDDSSFLLFLSTASLALVINSLQYCVKVAAELMTCIFFGFLWIEYHNHFFMYNVILEKESKESHDFLISIASFDFGEESGSKSINKWIRKGTRTFNVFTRSLLHQDTCKYQGLSESLNHRSCQPT